MSARRLGQGPARKRTHEDKSLGTFAKKRPGERGPGAAHSPHSLSNLARTLVPKPKTLGSTPWGPSLYWESGSRGASSSPYSLAWYAHRCPGTASRLLCCFLLLRAASGSYTALPSLETWGGSSSGGRVCARCEEGANLVQQAGGRLAPPFLSRRCLAGLPGIRGGRQRAPSPLATGCSSLGSETLAPTPHYTSLLCLAGFHSSCGF